MGAIVFELANKIKDVQSTEKVEGVRHLHAGENLQTPHRQDEPNRAQSLPKSQA